MDNPKVFAMYFCISAKQYSCILWFITILLSHTSCVRFCITQLYTPLANKRIIDWPIDMFTDIQLEYRNHSTLMVWFTE